MGAGNHPRTRKGQERGPRRGGKGHHGKRHDPHPGRAYDDGGTSAPQPPPNAPRLPGALAPTRTAKASIGRRTDHTSAHPPGTRKPPGEWRAHLHGKNGPHPQRKPQRTPPYGAPPRRHRQATTLAATRATSQAPEEDKGTATATRARTEIPRGHGTKAKAPREGNPTDAYPTHQPERHAQAPMKKKGPSETPTPNRTPQPPASHTAAHTPHHDTSQADLH